MGDRQNQLPSFDQVMQPETMNGKLPSFEDVMQEPVKKKDVGISGGGVGGGFLGGLLQDVKSKVIDDGEVPKEYEPEIKIDPNDPIKSISKRVLSKTEKFGSQGDIAGQKLSVQNKMNRKVSLDKMLPTFAGEVLEKAKDNIFPTTMDAANFLKDHVGKNDGSVSPDNQTAQIAIEQINDASKVVGSINGNNKDLSKAAVDYYAGKDDALGKSIRTMNGNVPNSLRGHLINDFLQTKGAQEWANTSQENHNLYKEQQDNFYQNFPEIRQQKILSDIAQWREDTGKNNPFLNLPGVKASDEAMEDLVKQGKLSVFDKEFYDKYTRPGIKMGAYEIPTPGLVESGFKSATEAIEDLPKGAYDLIGGFTGVQSLMATPAEREYERTEDELSKPNVKFKGFNELSNIMGNLAGVVVPIGAEGKALQSLNVINDAEKANRLAMMGTFYHGLYQDNLKDMDDPLKARVAGLLQTMVYGYISKTLPKVAKDVVSDSSPTIKELVQKLSNGEISTAAAAQEIANTAFGKAAGIAKTIGKGAENDVRMAGEMGLAQAINDNIKGAFSGKYDGDQTAQNVVNTFRTMLIGGGPLALLGARGHKEFNADMVNEIAENSGKTREHINSMAEIDPAFAKKAPELLQNLDHLDQVHEAVQKTEWSESQKKKMQLLSLNEKILTDKLKTLPDKDLGRDESKQLEEIKLEKEKTLNPDITNTDLIEKHFKADLIPKGFKSILENENGKFDENKVGEFLKKVAASDPEKLSEVPEQIVEIAKERWPDAGKSEEVTPVTETKVTTTEKPTITKEGIEQERSAKIEQAQKPEINDLKLTEEDIVESKLSSFEMEKVDKQHSKIQRAVDRLKAIADCIWKVA